MPVKYFVLFAKVGSCRHDVDHDSYTAWDFAKCCNSIADAKAVATHAVANGSQGAAAVFTYDPNCGPRLEWYVGPISRPPIEKVFANSLVRDCVLMMVAFEASCEWIGVDSAKLNLCRKLSETYTHE